METKEKRVETIGAYLHLELIRLLDNAHYGIQLNTTGQHCRPTELA